MKVVINTSPLIVLFKSNLADLLPQLFTEIIVPDGVWNEVVEAGKTDTSSQQLPQVIWTKRVNIPITPEILVWSLDQGESEVLSYAWENKSYQVIIDDAAARKVARTLKIPMLGTLGVLLLAKQNDLILSISDSIISLQNAGLWLSEDLIIYMKQRAGEL
jgi:predicted nucleic acid-binding protein